MTFSVIILDFAMEDIVLMNGYLRKKWGDNVADKAYIELMDKLQLLASQPMMGIECDELARIGKLNFRIYSHEDHTKFLYEVDEISKTLFVHLVYSSKQNFQALLYDRILRYF